GGAAGGGAGAPGDAPRGARRLGGAGADRRAGAEDGVLGAADGGAGGEPPVGVDPAGDGADAVERHLRAGDVEAGHAGGIERGERVRAAERRVARLGPELVVLVAGVDLGGVAERL